MSADTIVVMDQGQAVESGTFDELMALNGVFTSLVQRQTA
jgi:ATP-binding cassette subfamily C protein